MGTPKQVAKASDEADAKMKEIENQELEAAKNVVTVEALQPESPPVVPPPPIPNQPLTNPVTQSGLEQELPKKYERAEKAPTYEALAKQFDELQHKFVVLFGKYNAEIRPALESVKRIGELENIVKLQEEKIAKMAEPANIAPASQSNQPSKSRYEPTPEEKEQFGEDYLKMTEKVSTAVSEKVKQEIQGKLKELEIAQSQAKFDNMIQQVIAIHRDFLAIDQSDDFNDWLKLPDGFSGYTYKNSIDSAAASYDVEKICAIIEAYKKSKGISPRTQPQPMAPSLENQIAPSKSGSSTASPGKRMFSMAQIKKTYDAISKGQYTADQGKRLMEEIDAAIEQGLITT